MIYQGDQILMFHRQDGQYLAFPWQFPQGGLEPGEETEVGMWRELFEETGLVKEDFEHAHEFPSWLGYAYDQDAQSSLQERGISNLGQVHRWWLLELGEGVTINLKQASDQEFDDYQWVPSAECLKYVVPFKREVYQALLSYFETGLNK